MSKKNIVTRFHCNEMRLTHQWDRNGLTVTYHGSQPQTNRKVGERKMKHPKLKKLDLLKTNNAAEKDLVKYVVASILEKLGEAKTVKVLTDLNQAGVKLVDLVNALSGTARNVPAAPIMRWRLNEEGKTEPDYAHLGDGSPDHIEIVREHLVAEYGERKGRDKLRTMSGLEVVQLFDKIRKERESTITETGRVNLGGEYEVYPAPHINWSKVKK